MKQTVQTKSAALVAATNAEIEEDRRVHELRAASFRLERRLHDIRTRAFEAEAQARADYLAEIEAAPVPSHSYGTARQGETRSPPGRNRWELSFHGDGPLHGFMVFAVIFDDDAWCIEFVGCRFDSVSAIVFVEILRNVFISTILQYVVVYICILRHPCYGATSVYFDGLGAYHRPSTF
jgi:hypothetical protein